MQAPRYLLAVVAASVCATQLFAQLPTRIYYPDNNATTGGCNVIPFGHTTTSTTWDRQKYQVVVPSSAFGNKTGAITELGFACCRTGYMGYKTIKIRMDYFQGTGTTMSTTFANNISSKAVTVLDATDYRWHQVQNTWTRVGLQRPFVYIPKLGHLVIEITVTGAGGTGYSFRTGSVPRLYAYGSRWTGNTPPPSGTLGTSAALKMEIGFDAPALDTFGRGCAGSNSKVPLHSMGGSGAVGQSVTLSLADALPTSATYLVVGVNQLPTPKDMTVWGAPGCTLHISTDVILVAVTNGSGAYSGKFPLPTSSSAIGTKVYTQFFPFDRKVNAFGTSSSNYGRLLIGK